MTAAPDLKIGVDVPWVTSWSEEPQTGVSRCPSVDGQLAISQEIKPGVGEPVHTRAHLFRQRRSVGEMLCPMCGEPTHEDDRWSRTAQPTTAGALRARGLSPALPPAMPDAQPLLDCGAVAPMHRACADLGPAERLLPDDKSGRELRRFPKAWIIMPMWVEGRSSKPQGKSVAVVSFLQLVGVEDRRG